MTRKIWKSLRLRLAIPQNSISYQEEGHSIWTFPRKRKDTPRVVPNSRWLWWQSDCLLLTKSGIMGVRKFFVGGNWKMNGDNKKVAEIVGFLNSGSLSPDTGGYMNFQFFNMRKICMPPRMRSHENRRWENKSATKLNKLIHEARRGTPMCSPIFLHNSSF